MDKKEIIERLKCSRSWRETGISIEEVINALSECCCSGSCSHEAEEKQIAELKDKISKLTETNRQLRSEIKGLKSEK